MVDRYNPYCRDESWNPTRGDMYVAGMEEDSDGEYVRYEDYAKAVKALEQIVFIADEDESEDCAEHRIARECLKEIGG